MGAGRGWAAVELSDPFSDGNFTFGSDPLDGNFVRQDGTSQTLAITNDPVIGSGNALSYTNTTNGALVVGAMRSAATLGPDIGDQLDFGFDFRFTTLPTTPNSGLFRFGIYNGAGTGATDGGSETNLDQGYLADFGAGGSAGDAGLGKEFGGDDSLLGGKGAETLGGSTVLHPVDIDDTAAHHALLQLTRTASGVALDLFYDATLVGDGEDDASSFSTFNEVAFRLTDAGAVDYDNITVETTVVTPEPGSEALLIMGSVAVLGRRGRHSV